MWFFLKASINNLYYNLNIDKGDNVTSLSKLYGYNPETKKQIFELTNLSLQNQVKFSQYPSYIYAYFSDVS